MVFKSKSSLSKGIGHPDLLGKIVGRGDCYFCSSKSSMRQISGLCESDFGNMVPLKCSACDSVMIWLDHKLMPEKGEYQRLAGLPDNLQSYYDEAVDCMEAGAVNGASAVFRKLINVIGVHFGVIEENQDNSFKGIIEDMEDEGHIRKVSSEALDQVRDVGNDGAHVNENEPDMEQVEIMKELVEEPLRAIKSQQNIKDLEEKASSNN